MWLWWNYFAGNKNFFRLLKRHEDVKHCYSDLMSIWFHCDTGKSNKMTVSVWDWVDADQRLSVFSVLTNFIIFVLLNFVEIIKQKYLYCTNLTSISFSNMANGCQLPSLSRTAHTRTCRVHLATEITWASSASAEQYHPSHISLSDCASTDKILWSLYLPPIHVLSIGHGPVRFVPAFDSLWLACACETSTFPSVPCWRTVHACACGFLRAAAFSPLRPRSFVGWFISQQCVTRTAYLHWLFW